MQMSMAPSKESSSPDYFFKIIIVGDYKCGKTSLLCRYTDETFMSGIHSTISVDFRVKNLARKEKRIKLQIWDTAGHERFRTSVASYYRSAGGVLLVYDITNRQSFHSIGYWYDEMLRNCTENTKAVLIGNKCHLRCEREVTPSEGKAFAEEFGLPFYETSAEKNINVTECFDELVDSILAGLERQQINLTIAGITLPDDNRHLQNRHEVEGCSC